MRKAVLLGLVILGTSRVGASESWKTYTNTPYGYEFDYPADLSIWEGDFIPDVNQDKGTLVKHVTSVAVSLVKGDAPYGFVVIVSTVSPITFTFGGRVTIDCSYDIHTNRWTKQVDPNHLGNEPGANMNCCDNVEFAGKQMLPTYAYTSTNDRPEARNSVIFLNRPYYFMVNRSVEGGADEAVIPEQEKIADSFRLINGVQAITSGCKAPTPRGDR
jgi:hypothetical protein